jgi:hypothetical protein
MFRRVRWNIHTASGVDGTPVAHAAVSFAVDEKSRIYPDTR